jgi:hypothetical protein
MAFTFNRVPEVRGGRRRVGEVKSIAHGMTRPRNDKRNATQNSQKSLSRVTAPWLLQIEGR